MKRLLEGFQRFHSHVFQARKDQFLRLARKQNPETLFITCADSRIVPALLTQTDPGELFVCRTAGNIVPPYGNIADGVACTIEYAVAALGVKDIVVCGHTDCGAMHGVLHPEKLATLPATRSWLRYVEPAHRAVRERRPELTGDRALPALTEQNVVSQLSHLRTHPSVAARLAEGTLSIHGWIYDIPNGRISVLEWRTGSFLAVETEELPIAS